MQLLFLQFMNQLRNEAVLSFYIILSSDPHAAYYISVSIFFLMTRLSLISKICSSNHHIGVYLLIICSFDLCEYLVLTSYDLMLLI